MISTYDHFFMERMDHYDKGFEKSLQLNPCEKIELL